MKALKYFLSVAIFLFAFASTVLATVESASKSCQFFPTQPCTIDPVDNTIVIGSAQTIHWEASYNPFNIQQVEGNDFILSTSGNDNSADITIVSNLNVGFNQGDFLLQPGNYRIAVGNSGMGSGSYSITFNIGVTIAVAAPTSFNFGVHLANSAAASHTFSITLNGDIALVNASITSVTSSDPHFTITNSPPSPPGGVQVTFTPGATAGNFSSIITINASATGGTINTPITCSVTGTVELPVPDIDCINSGIFNLDYVVQATGTFNKSFENNGTASMTITSITIGNDGGGVFTLNGVPNTADLAAGSPRSVSIRFTPPAFEQTYTGSIIIVNDSPGETTKECTFTARAHHPEPNMVVTVVPDGGSTANYHDVEIGFTFTKGIKVSNTGDASLNLTLNLVDAADPDLPQWFEINEPNNVTVAAGNEQIFLQRFKPITTGTYTIQIEAQGTGGGGTYNATDIVTLTGNGISPVPMDNVLVLDRSGSMSTAAGSRTKIDALQKAARLYYDLLRPDPGDGSGDQIGMIKYSTNDQPYLTPLQMKNAANEPAVLDLLEEDAITDPARLKPSGSTCIGCGMETGASLLLNSPDSRKQVMIVMTDGKQNEDPRVNDVLGPIESANPDIMIYSIGLGNDIEANTLQQITNIGNGYHQVSEDLLGTNHFALEEFYFKIYSNASGADLIVDPTEAINLSSGNPVEVNRASIVSSDRYAIFMVLDDPALASFYTLEFIDPHGTILNPASSVGGIPIQILKRSGHTIYKIIFPDISQAHTYVGDWILRLNPTGKWKPGSRKDSLYANYLVDGEWIQPYQGMVPIGFGAAVKSDYNMYVSATAPNYQPGAEVLLTAQLSDRGWPSTGGQIMITATRPDNGNNNFELYDDGTHGDTQANDGTYSNTYHQTALEGSYKFFFNGKGINERGELVPRQATRYVSLFAPSPPDENGGRPDGGKNCFPCWLYWLMLLMLLVILWLIIRCCRRMKE